MDRPRTAAMRLARRSAPPSPAAAAAAAAALKLLLWRNGTAWTLRGLLTNSNRKAARSHPLALRKPCAQLLVFRWLAGLCKGTKTSALMGFLPSLLHVQHVFYEQLRNPRSGPSSLDQRQFGPAIVCCMHLAPLSPKPSGPLSADPLPPTARSGGDMRSVRLLAVPTTT
jgi:hypothetical protein